MNKDNKLTLSFITYSEISKLSSIARVKKILDIVLKNRIVILQGRLDATEEGSLIQSTMALVGKIKVSSPPAIKNDLLEVYLTLNTALQTCTTQEP